MASNYPLLVLAFFFRDRHGVTLLLSAVASLLYHRSHEKRYLCIDRTLAALAFASSLWRMRSVNAVIVPLLIVDIVCAFQTLRLSNRDKKIHYDHYHSLWHLFIVGGQLLLFFDRHF